MLPPINNQNLIDICHMNSKEVFYMKKYLSKTNAGKKAKISRMICMFLSMTMIFTCFFSLSSTALAADSNIEMNISYSPCKGNLSMYALPAWVSEITQGKTYYINMAATSDFYFDRYEVYLKAPGQSDYALIESYNPLGFFRWYNFQYTFHKAGTYYIKPVITTTNGTQYIGEFSFYVNETSNQSNSSSDTYSYNGYTYNVIPHFKTDYCFNQHNYSRFKNAWGKNRGCTATAMCIAYSIYHDTTLSPNDVKWCSAGTSWEYCDRYKEGNITYYGKTYSQADALKCVCNCLGTGKPIILAVKGAGSDHVVTAVGIRSGADYYNLSLSDILIVDPNGGEICTLAKYTGVDTGWGLRVPKD